MVKKNKIGKVSDLVGISDKRADEIINAFLHAKIDNDNWKDALNQVLKELNTSTVKEGIFVGWVFARMHELDSNPIDGLLSSLLKK